VSRTAGAPCQSPGGDARASTGARASWPPRWEPFYSPLMNRRILGAVVLVLFLAGCKKTDSATAPGGSAAAEQPAATAGAVAALTGFEGELDLLGKSPKRTQPVPVAVLVKGTKLRFDVPTDLEDGPKLGGKAYMVVSAAEKKVFTVLEAQHQVVVMGLESLAEQVKQWKPPQERTAEPEKVPPKVTKTGHTDVVAGYSCEDWEIVSAKGERARVCVSNQGASWFELPTIGLPPDQAWARELFDGHHLPLRFVGYDAAGAEDGRLEVSKIEKKALTDSLFEIPAGYRIMDMGEMMRGMMGSMPMMGMHAPVPGVVPSGLPSGFALPPGAQLPPGMKLPPGVTMPPNAEAMIKQMQERARAAGVAQPH